jgi:sRNA-binding protein
LASQYGLERKRGAKEARQQLAVLRARWPLAFPAAPEDIRPLAIGVARDIAAAMGWSLPYTHGVTGGWKMAPVYCRAVLCYRHRIGLDGAPAEAIDAEAKALATKRLAQIEARRTAKPAAAKIEAAPAAAAVVTPAAPRVSTEQLRAKVRAALLRSGS